jgi:hypothetical protein
MICDFLWNLMKLLFWQNSKFLPSSHCQNGVSDLELFTFRVDNFTNSLRDHDISWHNLIHVSLGADPCAHGGIDGNVIVSNDNLTILEAISGYGRCVLDLEDVGFFGRVIGSGGFTESDLDVELGVAFHGFEEFE